jgi:hypothetical protein
MKPVLIDRVWAGHPVGFALLTERGHQFVAYYDAERQLTIAGRKLGGEWTRVKPPGVVTGWDSHNYLRLALDRDGCVHFSGNMHNDPLVYYRTREPFDLTTLERLNRMTGRREQSVTYPHFFKNAEDDLFFRYRDGGSGRGCDLYNRYDCAARAWHPLPPVLDGQGRRSAYAVEPVLGPDGWFHLAWMWRDTPDCATNHTLSYMRTRDFVQWDAPVVLDAAKPGDGLINTTFALGFDAGQRPVIVYHRYDTQGWSQIYAVRPGETPRQLSRWNFRWAFGGLGSIDVEVRVGAPRLEGGALIVDYWTKPTDAGRWRVGENVEELPAPPPVVPVKPKPGMEMQVVAAGGWALCWETLPHNRDLPREPAPPSTELQLWEMS